MKILFLDIDGVLNNDTTTERITAEGYFNLCGVDAVLRDRYLAWCEGKGLIVVLSSMWRNFPFMKDVLTANGIFWLGETPRDREFTNRGREIDQFLDHFGRDGVTHYAILDDNDWFTAEQREHFVQTDPVAGLTDADLAKLDTILGF